MIEDNDRRPRMGIDILAMPPAPKKRDLDVILDAFHRIRSRLAAAEENHREAEAQSISAAALLDHAERELADAKEDHGRLLQELAEALAAEKCS
jgi:hypothetical protein